MLLELAHVHQQTVLVQWLRLRREGGCKSEKFLVALPNPNNVKQGGHSHEFVVLSHARVLVAYPVIFRQIVFKVFVLMVDA